MKAGAWKWENRSGECAHDVVFPICTHGADGIRNTAIIVSHEEARAKTCGSRHAWLLLSSSKPSRAPVSLAESGTGIITGATQHYDLPGNRRGSRGAAEPPAAGGPSPRLPGATWWPGARAHSSHKSARTPRAPREQSSVIPTADRCARFPRVGHPVAHPSMQSNHSQAQQTSSLTQYGQLQRRRTETTKTTSTTTAPAAHAHQQTAQLPVRFPHLRVQPGRLLEV